MAHERGWSKIKWGKDIGPEEHTHIFPFAEDWKPIKYDFRTKEKE